MINNKIAVSNVSLDLLSDKFLEDAGVEVKVLRLDKIDPITGGNKWFKLKLNIEYCIENKIETILTFGGAFSNHIAATAAAAKHYGLKSIGIIRGEVVENRTMQRAKSDSMNLHFVSREEYRNYRNKNHHDELLKKFGSCYIIPEGGSNYFGVEGCKQIAQFIPEDADLIFIPVGTAATMAGIINGLKNRSKMIGIAVVKANGYLENQLSNFISPDIFSESFTLIHDYTFGGYARKNQELDYFVTEFNNNHDFKIEPIYTGKMFFACFDMIRKGMIKKDRKVVFIHTGGLQYLE